MGPREAGSVSRSISCAQLFVFPWTAASQTPLSMGFPRQEYWEMTVCHFLFQGIFLTQGMKLVSPACISYNGRQVFYHVRHMGSPHRGTLFSNKQPHVYICSWSSKGTMEGQPQTQNRCLNAWGGRDGGAGQYLGPADTWQYPSILSRSLHCGMKLCQYFMYLKN